VDVNVLRLLSPEAVRAYMGDGNMGGVYEKPDDTMLEIWRVGVEETRAALEGPWSA
jgi:creatinine amidohydrolase